MLIVTWQVEDSDGRPPSVAWTTKLDVEADRASADNNFFVGDISPVLGLIFQKRSFVPEHEKYFH